MISILPLHLTKDFSGKPVSQLNDTKLEKTKTAADKHKGKSMSDCLASCKSQQIQILIRRCKTSSDWHKNAFL